MTHVACATMSLLSKPISVFKTGAILNAFKPYNC